MISTQPSDSSVAIDVIAPESGSPTPRSFRLTLEMTPDAFEDLHRLARDSGQSLDDVIRWALGMYRTAIDAHRAGKAVGIAEEPGRLETSFF